ncbi:MAG: acetoacetate decarboxylase family protein [Dehalococcoidia bacterium]
MRTRYVKSPSEIQRLEEINASPAFLRSTSLNVTFLSDPDVIRELLPPPLEPAVAPRVSISVYEFAESNCVGPFNGASVNISCEFNREGGLYCLTMPMSTDTAVIFGRELYAEPKKLARCSVERNDRFVRGIVERHGVTYIEITGLFDEPLADIQRETVSQHYYFKYLPDAAGRGLTFDPQLVRVTHRGRTHQLTRGAGTIVLRESPHDPVIDIPVLEVESATFSHGETHTSAKVVATVPAATFLPWAFGKQDDLAVFAGPTSFNHGTAALSS